MQSLNNYKILCFIPEKFKFLTESKFIYHDTHKLKSAYLAHILNEILTKYTLTGENKIKIWSNILQKMYGKTYARYMDYLISNGIIHICANKQVGKSSRKYKLNLDFINSKNIKRCYFQDMFLFNKLQARKADTTFEFLYSSPIKEHIRLKLVDDVLYHINLDCDKAMTYLNSIKYITSTDSYLKNEISIINLKDNNIYYKFDSYGRMHTNFTNLKKYMRINYITIDNDDVIEIDIKNSQPFFLGFLIKQEIPNLTAGLKHFIELVYNHIFYEDFQNKAQKYVKNREQAKDYIYQILFGKNYNTKINNIFESLYPEVFKFIVDFKTKAGSYKILSHKLQQMESDFVYNTVINEIMSKYPHIRMFTVHDSIIFPVKYKKEVEEIFNKNMILLKNL